MAKTKQVQQIIQELDQHIQCLKDIKKDLILLFTENDEVVEKTVIKLEDVRAVLAEKTRLGFTKEIKQIILDLGATKLSEVKPQDYPTILEKVEGLGNE